MNKKNHTWFNSIQFHPYLDATWFRFWFRCCCASVALQWKIAQFWHTFGQTRFTQCASPANSVLTSDRLEFCPDFGSLHSFTFPRHGSSFFFLIKVKAFECVIETLLDVQMEFSRLIKVILITRIGKFCPSAQIVRRFWSIALDWFEIRMSSICCLWGISMYFLMYELNRIESSRTKR